jgi:hypothetical protein
MDNRIIDGNEMICTFMGYERTKSISKNFDLNDWIIPEMKNGSWYEDDEWKDYIYYGSHHLKYHKSWDWLMPVVKKCLAQQGEHRWVVSFDWALLKCDIEKLWDAVIKYIEYRNSIKEKAKRLKDE